MNPGPAMHTFISITLEHVIVRLCIVHEIIAFSSVTHTYMYIHTNYLRDVTRNYLPRTKALSNYVYACYVESIFFIGGCSTNTKTETYS